LENLDGGIYMRQIDARDLACPNGDQDKKALETAKMAN